MGYATNYSIAIKGKRLNEKEHAELETLKKQANKLTGKLKEAALKGLADQQRGMTNDPQRVITDIVGYDPFEDSCKWYEHDNHMETVSKQYPETIFILSGEGEEAGDLWKKYYFNGKVQRAEAVITYEEFDEKKLKPIKRVL